MYEFWIFVIILNCTPKKKDTKNKPGVVFCHDQPKKLKYVWIIAKRLEHTASWIKFCISKDVILSLFDKKTIKLLLNIPTVKPINPHMTLLNAILEKL
jgi:hypothetical protein